MIYQLVLFVSLVTSVIAVTTTPNTGDQTNGFLFDYVRSYPAALPIVESCPAQLQFGPVTVPFGGAEPAPPFTAMHVTSLISPHPPIPSDHQKGESVLISRFLVNEAFIGPNGTVDNRMYTYSTSFTDGLQINPVNLPFMNGTQFMVCMWAANGISGGCQDLYNVYASPAYPEVYGSAESTCRGNISGSWVPSPKRSLAVNVFGENGVVAERAWPASCSDLRFTPKNGTAPYTLIISPAMHPPVNISSNSTFASDNSMNYTIRLSHGSAFWTTVFDATGASWSSGPYHAGTNKNVGCLATLTGQDSVGGVMADTKSESQGGIGIGALVGGIVGAFFAGLILAALAMMLLAKKKRRSHNGSTESLDGYNDTQVRPAAWRSDTHPSIAKPQSVTPYTNHSPLPEVDEDPHPYLGYVPDSPRGRLAAHLSNDSLDENERAYRQSVGLGDFQPTPQRNHSSVPSAPSDSAGPSSQVPSGPGGRQVYVVHSDGGNNVHITLPEGGAEVVELPPHYPNSGGASHGDDKSRMG